MKIAGGFTAANGPVCSRLGYVLFTDAGRILRWEKGQTAPVRDGKAVCLTFDHQGRMLATEADRVTRTEKDGSITTLAEVKGARDIVYAIDGSVYFTAGNAVYQVQRGGKVRVFSRIPAQALALAPNQQKLYVAADEEIRVFDIQPDGGLGSSSVVAKVKASGIKTAENGSIWLATAEGVLSLPDKKIPLPEPATNLNWGEGFRNLYVTTATSLHKVDAAVNGTRTY